MLCDAMVWFGMYVCIYVSMYLCIYDYICKYVYMYICIYDPAFHPGTYSETLCGTTKNEVVPQLDCKL